MRTWQWIVSLLKTLLDIFQLFNKLTDTMNELRKKIDHTQGMTSETINMMFCIIILICLVFPFPKECWSSQEKSSLQYIVYQKEPLYYFH